ncbi:Bud site selection protein, Revert to axial protein 1 [Coemansia spiralis]|uniref:Bud site selection protein, Revert to axial protein 1 n=1 Tax=Coemansia spiralis TaxID=417178 RepID=A0A9W8GMT3_9FUNG|nr:Bud site selection protein, Revert to axial protein 1 [Coemansia spiralis]
MSEKLHRKQSLQQQQDGHQRPDSSSYLTSVYVVNTRHEAASHSPSPLTESELFGRPDTTPALNNAAALVSTRKHPHALPRHNHAAIDGSVSTINELPGRHPHSYAPVAGAHPAAFYSQNTFDRETPGELITTSLLDPHPIVVPPPGSRLAFAGATSRETTHTFRSLPSLEDTLLRRARAPLCLYNYWQYLADIESSPEELEFWLSLADYEELHRRFAHIDPPRANSPLLSQGARAFRSGRVESGALGRPSAQDSGTTGRPAATLRTKTGPMDVETQELDDYLARLSHQTMAAALDSRCRVHRQCRDSHCPFTQAAAGRPTLDMPQHQLINHGGIRGFFSRIFSGEHNNSLQPVDVPAAELKEQSPPTEDELRRAAEQLYFHYFLPGGPSELYIGPQLRDEITSRVERDQRLDAELFLPAKRHAYEAMRNESYLRFLRERLLHNTTRGTAAPRIALGLVLVFVALVCQLSLIFLDVTPKGWRWLPVAAMWPGFTFAVAGVSRLDPFMALMGRYEPTPWHFDRVLDPTIRDAHLKRASMQLIGTAAVASIITLVMFLVPGHRL